MHKFIRTNNNQPTHIFVCEYNWPIEETLKGMALVIKINNLDDILNIQKHLDETTKIDAFIYRDKYASLETMDINPAWGSSPIILYINRLGQFREVYHKIELLKCLNIVVIFTGTEAQACKDAQILSSLGIHTGIEFSPESELSDSVLDLITYYFYGTLPHAQIEPFATIEKNYDGENYVNPTLANFINPERYIHIDKNYSLAFSSVDLLNGKVLDCEFPIVNSESLINAAEKYSLKWQELFIESHSCTFCPAFRICMGYFCKKDGFTKPNCRTVMSDLLDGIEFYKSKLNNNIMDKCQL